MFAVLKPRSNSLEASRTCVLGPRSILHVQRLVEDSCNSNMVIAIATVQHPSKDCLAGLAVARGCVQGLVQLRDMASQLEDQAGIAGGSTVVTQQQANISWSGVGSSQVVEASYNASVEIEISQKDGGVVFVSDLSAEPCNTGCFLSWRPGVGLTLLW